MGQLEQIQKDMELIKAQNRDILTELSKANDRLNKIEKPEKEPKIVNIKELVKYRPFLKSVSTVRGMLNRRQIPYSKPGKYLLFNLEDVDNYFESKKLKAV